MPVSNTKKKLAIQFILLFGLISALGDITYEGARSIYGPYLGFLGASAFAVGLISGFGEFFGYFLRLISGYFVDRTKKFWLATIIGYGLLVSVPLLASAGKWELAALFVILERTGKAIRSPGKDAMLSYATKQVGTGTGFGIHEAMDQVGAIIGPLIFSASLALTGEYKQGLIIMWIPAVLTIAVVIATRIRVPKPEELEESKSNSISSAKTKAGLSKVFWIYAIFTFLCVLGFVNFPILSYHISTQQVVTEAFIPTLYAIAMAVDAVVALIIGRIYDKMGFASLVVAPVLTLPIAILGFTHNSTLVIIAVMLWGAVMGIHETTMRAAIADIISMDSRGKAYGVFNTLYGTAMLIGGILMGFLYQYSVVYILLLVLVVEIASLLLFVFWRRQLLQ